ncbi:MAG: ADP-ribosylglycohydrolase family protein [Chloroflexota bacterium]
MASFIAARQEQYEGCLLGLALGDALGAPVEFLELTEIRREYGPEGITGLERWREFRPGSFTDDTQMSLATARGCIDAYLALRHGDTWRPARMIYGRYLAWLKTQEIPYMNRAPGSTCLWALRSGRAGTIMSPINSRKGCGGVMRAAPAGLAFPPAQAFIYGAEFAALTHGHPSGYLPAGVLADVVARLLEGCELAEAVERASTDLVRWPGHEETLASVQDAVSLAAAGMSPAAAIQRLGGGWVGEEALAISLYCALSFADDWEGGVLAAVNHSGDSDSTGCITGAVLGTKLGCGALPDPWLNELESASGIRALAADLFRVVREGASSTPGGDSWPR